MTTKAANNAAAGNTALPPALALPTDEEHQHLTLAMALEPGLVLDEMRRVGPDRIN